jgi:small subunit ribosomal protein S21
VKQFSHYKRRFNRNDTDVVGTAVALREGESPESLIRRFKKTVEMAGIMRELKRREHHLSPSEKKKDKRKKALKRQRKEAKRAAMME